MKKFLGIIVLGLLWSNIGFAACIEGEQAKEVLELLKNDADRTYDNYEMMLNERLENVSSNRE